MKACSRCARTLPVEHFHMKGGGLRRPECRDCFKAARPRSSIRPSAAKIGQLDDGPAYQRFYKYGLTPDEYADMVALQGDACAICDSPPSGSSAWQVDHCHETGKVRGLLCRPCNLALGLMRDDTDRLKRAVDYLNTSRVPR